MLRLDHIAVSGATLAEAADAVGAALGVRMQPGGRHDVFATHNCLLGLEGGLYLEAIAADPAARRPERARWFGLDGFAGPARLSNWICRCDDLEAALDALGTGAGLPVEIRRGDLRWVMAVPSGGALPFDNLHPALMAWRSAAHPTGRLAPSGIALRRLTVRHPRAMELCQVLAGFLDDDRVAFEQGAPGLHAAFDTPSGPRALGG